MNLFELFVKLGVDDSEFNRGLDDASSKVSSIAKGMGAAFAAVTAAAAAGIAAFATSSVKTGETFDKSMSQVAATMGKTVDEIQNLREYAQKMGSETAFSASQAADALNYMALAGYDAETSMKMLPNVLNLAAAGGMELATASDMVTDAQSALGLTLDQTTGMVDQMAVASSKTNTSVSQLGEAFLTVGGTAKMLQGGTAELAASLGLLADNGIKGAEGGTALRNILMSMSSARFEKTFGKLGVSAYDAEGNMRSLQDVLEDMNKVMDGMTMQEKTELLGKVFNKFDLKSINALLATNADRWDEVTEAIGDATGAAERMANTQLDNLAGDVTLFQSALEGAQIAISDKLTPTLREFVQFGSESLSNLTAAFKEDGLDGVIDAFGDAISNGIALINDKLPLVIDAGTKILGAVADGILENLPAIADAGIEIIFNLIDSITEALPDLLPKLIDITSKIAETIINHVDDLIAAGAKLVSVLMESLLDQLPTIIEKSLTLVGMVVGEIASAIIKSEKELNKNGENILDKVVKGIISAIANVDWKKITDDISDAWLKNGGIDEGTQNAGLLAVGNAILNHVTKGILNFGVIGLASKELVKAFQDGVNDALEHGGGGTGGHRGGGGHRGDVGQRERPQIGNGYYETSSDLSDYAKSLEEQAAQWDSVDKALNEAAGNVEATEEEIKAKFEELETQMYTKGLSDAWLVNKEREYIETLDHSSALYKEYNLKLLKDEKKVNEATAKERENQQSEFLKKQKETVEKRFMQLENEMNKQGFSEEWLIKQERMYIETLDHNTELYEEYNNRLLKAERKISDTAAAERKKQAQENQKKFFDMIKDIKTKSKTLLEQYQKAVDDIKSKMQSFGESLTKSFTDMFAFETDEKTGKITATKTKNFITDATKQLEQYYANIQKLKNRNVSDSLLNQLVGMNTEEGKALTDYWNSLTDEQLKSLDENWKKYEATGQKISESLYSDELADAEKQYDEERNTLLGEIKQEIADNADAVTGAIASIFSDMTGNVQINVAGMPVIKKGINEILATIKNSGGVLDV